MFKHTEDSLQEFEDYIEQLDETVGLTTETYKEVKKAISKERAKLKKCNISNVTRQNRQSSCPFCKSDDLFEFELKHSKCRKCKEQWTN